MIGASSHRVLALLLVATAGCAECYESFDSDEVWTANAIAEGGERVMVAATRSREGVPIVRRLFLVTGEGTVTPLADVPMGPSTIDRPFGPTINAGVGGTTTALWYGRDETCALPETPLGAVLVRFDGATAPAWITVTDESALSASIVHDGAAYQAFWTLDNHELRHREVREDGTLGAVHTLGTVGQFSIYKCITAVSDGSGGAFVVAGTEASGADTALAIDTAAGMSRELWRTDHPDGCGDDDAFWLAGELRIKVCPDGGQASPSILAIDPVAGTLRVDALPAELAGLANLRAKASSFLGTVHSRIVEVSADHTSVEEHGHLGTDGPKYVPFGDGVIYLERVLKDPPHTPGRAQVTRVEGGTTVWQSTVAVDSPLIRTCRVPDPRV